MGIDKRVPRCLDDVLGSHRPCPQLPRLSLVVMMTRVVALVPAPSSSKMRTL